MLLVAVEVWIGRPHTTRFLDSARLLVYFSFIRAGIGLLPMIFPCQFPKEVNTDNLKELI